MLEGTYTYRIRLANWNHVQVEIFDAGNQEGGQPRGAFGYKDALRQEIDGLIQLARQKQLPAQQVRQLGEALCNALFDDVLRQNFVDLYYKIVQSGGQKLLRVELDVDELDLPMVAALPWEFMCLPAQANLGSLWFGTEPNIIFSRRRSQWQPAPAIQLKASEKLRLVLAIAAPQDLEAVAYEELWQALTIMAAEPANRIELLAIINPANPEEIDSALAQKPHIFHFIGHGRWQNDAGDSVPEIALVDDLGDALWVDADYFSELFNQHRPGIVMLQACDSGALSASQAFVGVASRIVQQNIPVVVAMQYEVSNSTANRFARRFYQQLAQGDPVDRAAQYGRRAIALGPLQYKSRDFATPVLFMRVRDGRLFERSTPSLVETRPSAQVVQDEAVRQCLAQLNYTPQRDRFADIFDRQEKMGAFLISGPAQAGPRWLLNLLVQELDNRSGQEVFNIDVASPVVSQDVQSLYRELGERLGLDYDTAAPDIIAAAGEVWQEKDVLLVLNNVAHQGVDYPTRVVEEFWRPLVTQALKQPSGNWLLLFLVDHSGQVSSFVNLPLPDLLAEDWHPDNPVPLPRLAERFAPEEVRRWLGYRTTREALTAVYQRPGINTRDDLLAKLLQQTDNGVPYNLLVEVCRLSGYKWSDVQTRWMKL
jgi:hypothetical protein